MRPGDTVSVVLIPQGGNTFKSILRITLQVAALAAYFIPGVGPLVATAINVAVALINTFVLTPRAPKLGKNQDTSGTSYGIDGAKNTATEGVPVPVGYGEFRYAGNISDCYTENVGDDQYLYMRTILNDGEIDSISDVELNEQALSTFSDVEFRWSKGAASDQLNNWFSRAIVPVNKSIKLDTTWTTHTTTTPVNQVRLDVTFPQGLVSIDDKKGTYKNKSINLEIEWSPAGQNAWQSVNASSSFKHTVTNPMSTAVVTPANGSIGATAFVSELEIQNALKANPNAVVEVLYRPVSSTGIWVSMGTRPLAGYTASGSVVDASIAGIIGWNQVPGVNFDFQASGMDDGSYTVMTSLGVISEYAVAGNVSGSSTHTVSDNRTRQIRKSFESQTLPTGIYDVRIRRTTPQSTSQNEIDEVWLTDVNQITNDQVALLGRANMSIKVKLNEQLNQIPTLTAKVKYSVLQEYDEEGNPTVRRWSANPAWATVDVLRRVNYGLSRIEFAQMVDWANYCDANSLTFNGVFDQEGNVADAIATITRVGEANPLRLGTKFSVAIDRPTAPRMLFGAGNILKDTFKITYSSLADRANEFEFTYFDKTNRNKSAVVRYVDPNAVQFGDMPRPVAMSLPGVDNFAQAHRELWRALYSNRLLVRNIEIGVPLEALGISIGQVALIEHNAMNWEVSGRLKAGSTTTQLNLDQPVTMTAGVTYGALAHLPAVKRGQVTLSSIVGKRLMVTGDPSFVGLSIERVIIAGNDYQVVRMEAGASVHTITLEDVPQPAAAGSIVELWDTDVVEEVNVSSVTADALGALTVVHLATPLSVAPAEFANFAFGEATKVKRPYRLRSITGEGVDTRTLGFMEYNEGVYAAPEHDIPIPTVPTSAKDVKHVTGLGVDYQPVIQPSRTFLNVHLHWNAAGTVNYGGCDIYMSLNGGAFRSIGQARDTTEFTLTLAPNDQAILKVIAFNKLGFRAPMNEAPIVGVNVDVKHLKVSTPTAGTWTAEAVTMTQGAYSVPAFKVAGTVDNPLADHIDYVYREAGTTDWISDGLSLASSPERYLTKIVPGASYDLGVRYVEMGFDSDILTIATLTATNTTIPWGGVLDVDGSKPQNGATRNFYHGAYSASQLYTLGDEVSSQGAIWRYINATPSSGNAPPTLPEDADAYWQLYIRATDAAVIGYLTNESVNVAADSNGLVGDFSLATGVFRVLDGLDEVTTLASFEIYSETGVEMAIDASGNYHVIDMTAAQGKATLHATYGSVTIAKDFSIVAVPGGASAKLLTVISDRQTVSYEDTLPAPANQDIVFSVNRQNTSAPVHWTITDMQGNVFDPSIYLTTITGDTTTLPASAFNSLINQHGSNGVIVTGTIIDGVTVSDKISVTKVSAGATGAGAFTLVNYGPVNAQIAGATITKTGSVATFDTRIRSQEGFVGGAVGFSFAQTDHISYVGLVLAPSTFPDWGWKNMGDGTAVILANGSVIGAVDAWPGSTPVSVTDTWQTVYDGVSSVYWFKNGALQYSLGGLSPNSTMYFNATLITPGTQITKISFTAVGVKGSDGVGSWTPVLTNWTKSGATFTKSGDPNDWVGNVITSQEQFRYPTISAVIPNVVDYVMVGFYDPATGNDWALYHLGTGAGGDNTWWWSFNEQATTLSAGAGTVAPNTVITLRVEDNGSNGASIVAIIDGVRVVCPAANTANLNTNTTLKLYVRAFRTGSVVKNLTFGASGVGLGHIAQGSTDGTTWHTPASGDKYLRFSADGGATWSSALTVDASTVLAEIEAIQSDGVLSRNEKQSVIIDVQAIVDEFVNIDAQANALGITTAKTNYENGKTALLNYLNSLSPAWNDTTTDTVLTGGVGSLTFRQRFADYYSYRAALLKAITDNVNSTAQAASTTAASANAAASSANSLATIAKQFADDVADNNKFSGDEKKRWYQRINTWAAPSSNAGSVAAILQTLTSAGLGSNAAYSNLSNTWSTFYSLLNSLNYSTFSTTTYTSVGSSKSAFLSVATNFENALQGAANALTTYATTLATAAPSNIFLDPNFLRMADPLSWVSYHPALQQQDDIQGRRAYFPSGQGGDVYAVAPPIKAGVQDRIDIEFEYYVGSGASGGQLGIWTNIFDGNGNVSGQHPSVTVNISAANKNQWMRMTGSIKLSDWVSNVNSVGAYVQAQAFTGGACYIRNPRAYRIDAAAQNIGADGTALSRRLVSPFFGGGAGAVYNNNPLTANSSQIFIAAHVVYDDAGSLSYGSGTISGLSASTSYAVYEDTGYVSGSPTYSAVTLAEQLTYSSKRRLVGSITTAAAGGSTTTGGTGGGGYRCVAFGSHLPVGLLAEDVIEGTLLTILDSDRSGIDHAAVRAVAHDRRPCVELVMATGESLVVSVETEVVFEDGTSSMASAALGRKLPCMKRGEILPRWEEVMAVNDAGEQNVVAIDGGGVVYAAGSSPDEWIFTHNKVVNPDNF